MSDQKAQVGFERWPIVQDMCKKRNHAFYIDIITNFSFFFAVFFWGTKDRTWPHDLLQWVHSNGMRFKGKWAEPMFLILSEAEHEEALQLLRKDRGKDARDSFFCFTSIYLYIYSGHGALPCTLQRKKNDLVNSECIWKNIAIIDVATLLSCHLSCCWLLIFLTYHIYVMPLLLLLKMLY